MRADIRKRRFTSTPHFLSNKGREFIMKKIWVNKANSFQEAERFDKQYYRAMSKIERLEIVQFLREEYLIIKGRVHEGRKGLRRVVRVVQ